MIKTSPTPNWQILILLIAGNLIWHSWALAPQMGTWLNLALSIFTLAVFLGWIYKSLSKKWRPRDHSNIQKHLK
jgi:hypothetical protein